ETAEMPGMYAPGDYDLAGFAVGCVNRRDLIDGSRVSAGDVLLGLAASGPHSNGYSLIRAVLDRVPGALEESLGDTSLATALMQPTRIYVRALLALIAATPVHALAHVTGGGLIENVPRVLPAGTRADIDFAAWQRPAVFDWLATAGDIPEEEMLRTFNCGIGMVVVVPADTADTAMDLLQTAGETVFRIGHIAAESA
ncbi:MAG: phosphoribosylformylglycinamidine cyclo-ligase, partial [Pseudomonadota bacterium]